MGSSGERLKRLLDAVRQIGTDRRGATAVVFALGATALLGLVGLATEGGTWYVEKRHGQNTADAAAMAGVLALAAGGTSASAKAVTAGTSIATANNYSAGSSKGTATTVAVVTGTYSAQTFTPTTMSPNAVRAVITRSPPRLFSALFLKSDPNISETAIALLDTTKGKACALSLSQPLSFGGNATISAPGCALASNNSSPTGSIGCTGSSSVTAGALVASGGISGSGCTGTKSFFQPPTADPFVAIQSLTMPPVTASKTTCQNMPTIGTPLTSINTYEVGHKMFCTGSFGGNKFSGDLSMTNGNTVNLVPGTYIFYNASISIQGGVLQCPTCTCPDPDCGVTIILTGSPASQIGTLKINGNATVNLHAPRTNNFNSAFNGVLFYMDKNAPPGNGHGNAPVDINGGANTVLSGGMYFPSVNANYNGNVNGGSNCTEIVGYSLEFSGNTNLDLSACAGDGTQVAQPQAVHLVM
jgi:Flp pilus assembly protein TadG